jgi:hypothetical protein
MMPNASSVMYHRPSCGIYKISPERSVRETYYVKCNRMRARARSKAVWLNSVLLGRFEVAAMRGGVDAVDAAMVGPRS